MQFVLCFVSPTDYADTKCRGKPLDWLSLSLATPTSSPRRHPHGRADTPHRGAERPHRARRDSAGTELTSSVQVKVTEKRMCLVKDTNDKTIFSFFRYSCTTWYSSFMPVEKGRSFSRDVTDMADPAKSLPQWLQFSQGGFGSRACRLRPALMMFVSRTIRKTASFTDPFIESKLAKPVITAIYSLFRLLNVHTDWQTTSLFFCRVQLMLLFNESNLTSVSLTCVVSTVR